MALSVADIVKVVFFLLVVGGIFSLLFFAVDWCKVREPFNWFIKCFLVLAAVFLLINLLLGFIGQPIIRLI